MLASPNTHKTMQSKPKPKPQTQNLWRSLLLACLLAASALSLTGCATDDSPEGSEQVQTFSLQPSITVRAARTDIQLDRLFLGVGSIYLEPLDSPGSPVISAADSLALTFEIDADGQATILLPEVSVAHSGRYLVSIAIEPLPVPTNTEWPSALLEGASKSGFSVLIQGLLMHDIVGDTTDPRKDEPEPLPWRISVPKEQTSVVSLDGLDQATVECIPFEYQSDRTGFIRLGEVKIGTERNELHISIDLNHWLDAAIVPVIDKLDDTLTPPTDKPVDPNDQNPTDLVDLNDYGDIRGLDLEHVFGTTHAEAR